MTTYERTLVGPAPDPDGLKSAARQPDGRPAGGPTPHDLPVALTSFVGREAEVADLVRLVCRPLRSSPAVLGQQPAATGGSGLTAAAGHPLARLVTLVGAGGAGKTRLALQIARAAVDAFPPPFAHGIWLVELASVVDPRRLPHVVAGTLSVREVPGVPMLTTLTTWLRERHLLLVLDNCEHLIADCAPLVETALLACPHLRVLATSREPLDVPGEFLWRVPALPVPRVATAQIADYAAVRLFLERARAAAPGFTLTEENAVAVARICQRLDGIPLAIELAAARVRVLAVEQIAARLDDRFRLLTTGSRAAPPHQQTLRASMDWSHDLLSTPEREAFARLSVFAGGWTLDAAEALIGEGVGEDVLDLLANLVDKSLVSAEEDGAGVTRYRMLESVRQYAAERLAATGTADEVAGRHVAYFTALAEQGSQALNGPQQASWLDRLEVEHENLQTALRWSGAHGEAGRGETGQELRLATALWKFWAVRGHHIEGQHWLEGALARVSRGPSPPAEAAADAPEPSLLARANNAAGNLARARRDYRAARAFHEAALGQWRRLEDRRGIATSLSSLGSLANDQGDADAARPLYEQSLSLRRELGDVAGIAVLLSSLGNLAYNRRDFAAARASFDEGLAVFRGLGDEGGIALLHTSLGQVARATGEVVEAASHGRAGLAHFRRLGDRWGTSLALGLLGQVAQDEGTYHQAALYLEECVAILRQLDDRWSLAVALHRLAKVELLRGDLHGAAVLCRECLALAAAGGLQRHVASGLETAAALLLADARATPEAQSHRAQLATELLGAAIALRERNNAPLLPADQAYHDETVASLRRRLGTAPFAAAEASGRSQETGTAVARALEALAALTPQ